MNKKLNFRKLTSRAQEAPVRDVQVADAIMARLSNGERLAVKSNAPLLWISSLSAAAAIALAGMAYLIYQAQADNALTEIYQSVAWVKP